LLLTLGANRDEGAERYESVRRRLIKYFSWQRVLTPEDCADEALNRTAKRLLEGENIAHPDAYIYGVARLIARETATLEKQRNSAMEQFSRLTQDAPEEDVEAAHQCLDRCLSRLPAGQSEFIIEYYRGSQQDRIEARKRLADRHGIPLNALRNRALRLREKLEDCMRGCMSGASQSDVSEVSRTNE
jgi:DNA-directed RNA polymerase specialized sigma24 family protein